MQEQLRDLAVMRDLIATNKAAMKAVINEAMESSTYKEAAQFLEDNLPELKEVEDNIREATIEAYRKTANKHPVTGVGIRETVVVNYNEDEQTFAWVNNSIPDVLVTKISEKPFVEIIKTMAKAGMKLPAFIRITKKITATIATDLSDYLYEKSFDEDKIDV